MKYRTNEQIRKKIIEAICGKEAKLGVDYIDWHSPDGICGLSILFGGDTFEITINNTASRAEL